MQVVTGLSFEIRVMLLTLRIRVFHGGKFLKSKKTLGFEFNLVAVAFPHLCEGITPAHLADSHALH